MIQAGCFDIIQGPKVVLRHTLKPGYAGPFRSLAEDYEKGGKTTFTAAIKAVPHASEAAAGIICLSDFLSGRWQHDAFRSIADGIADGDIRARGVAIDGERRLPNDDMRAASVTNAMWMDADYTVWEGPKAMWGEQPRRWIEITVSWDDLLKCFEPTPTHAPTQGTVAAETRCREWLIREMLHSPKQTDTSKIEWYRTACEKFAGLGEKESLTPSRSFVRAWTAAVNCTGAKWGLSGRKKSKR
jgi:hypothetical protein